MKNQANFEATQYGYRVTIRCGGKVIASAHHACNVALLNRHPSQAAEEAYKAAKKYAAQFGCE